MRNEPLALPNTSEQAAMVLRSLGLFLIQTGTMWVIWYILWQSFPYMRNGAQITIDAKLEEIDKGELFAGAKPEQARIAFFGNSQVISGFIPDDFDRLSGGATYSYNLGLAGIDQYIPTLERMLNAGNRATHVFLILPWPGPSPPKTIWYRLTHRIEWYNSDQTIADTIFPFRKMPRDFFVFIASAPAKGGMVAFYEYGRQAAKQMIADRGYYFIEAQSRHADFRLPEDWTHLIDEPDVVYHRDIIASGPAFDRLQHLAATYGFQYYLVPTYNRFHWRAKPPEINKRTVDELEGHPLFHVLGPDYWQYPNRDFADGVHVNRDGAVLYTDDLWKLTKPIFNK